MPKSSRVKHNAQPHWNKGLAIVLLIERVEIKSKAFRGFAMKHLCPNGSRSVLLFFIFSRFLPLLGQDPNKNLEKTNKNKHSNVSALVPAGLEVLFFLPAQFFCYFWEKTKRISRSISGGL